jgi:hypothetical protein
MSLCVGRSVRNPVSYAIVRGYRTSATLSIPESPTPGIQASDLGRSVIWSIPKTYKLEIKQTPRSCPLILTCTLGEV